MIKKRMAGVVVFSLLVVSLGLSYGAEPGDSLKVGYVDVNRVAKGYVKMDGLRKSVEERRSELNARAKEIEKMEKALQDQESVLKQKEKEKRSRAIKQKVENIQILSQEFRKKTWEEEGKLSAQILETIKELGKEAGYSLILDRQAVLYGLPGQDLTEEIIKLLNTAEGSTANRR